jgi:hypothetical protein
MTAMSRKNRKDQIAKSFLDNALRLFFVGEDRLTVLVLALVAEEILEGIFKGKGRANLSELTSARGMVLTSLELVHEREESHPRTRRQIKDQLKRIFFDLTHQGGEKTLEFQEFDAEFEVQEALLRAVQIHAVLFHEPTEQTTRFMQWEHSHKTWA